MKKLISLLCIIFILFSGVSYAANAPQAVLDARSSTVPIEIYAEGTTKLYGVGSGFAIGKANQPIEYIVTNDHVGGIPNTYCVVYFKDYIAVKTTVLFTIPEADLCVLKLETPMEGINPFPLSDATPSTLVGERVYALGFPASANNLFSKGDSTISDVTITDGIISAIRRNAYIEGGSQITLIQMNVSISGGNSGGPLINSDGVVVGVNTFGSAENMNMNGAISITELFAALNEYNVPYELGASTFSLAWWLIVLIISIAVVIVIIFILILKQKSKHKHQIQGMLLSKYLQVNAPMQFEMATYLLLPVFQAARTLELQGKILHTLSSHNIIVQTSSGRAYISHHTTSEHETDYMAPEQYKPNGRIGSWTDVYRLGSMLYHALAGEVLPDALSRCEDDRVTMEHLVSLPLTQSQKEALLKSLQAQPEDRFYDTNSFMEALYIADLPKVPAPIRKK